MYRRFAGLSLLATSVSLLCVYACVGDPPPASDSGRPDAATPVDAGQPSSGECEVDEKRCNERCVKIDDPLYGCSPGSCEPCPENAFVESIRCDQGNCKVATCTEGRADCDNRFTPNGCETDITSARACGACAPQGTCGATALNCSSDGGTGYTCTPTCAAGLAVCGDAGACVNLETSIAHCGGCGKACPVPTNSGTATCIAKTCGKRCLPGMTLSPDGTTCVKGAAGVCLADGLQRCTESQQCCSGSCAFASPIDRIKTCVAVRCIAAGAPCNKAVPCCSGVCGGVSCK